MHRSLSWGFPFLLNFVTRNSCKAFPDKLPYKKSPSSLYFFSVEEIFFWSGISSSRNLFAATKVWAIFFYSIPIVWAVGWFLRNVFEFNTYIFVSKVISSYFSVGLSVKILGLISITVDLRFLTLVFGSIKRSSKPNALYPPNLSISSLVTASLARLLIYSS